MDPRLIEIQKQLDAADASLSSARSMIREISGTDAAPLDMDKKLDDLSSPEEKTIEGVFDGEMMIAPDGKTYPIPPNYASKSKLVEGDTLKLTISDDGSFVFKQIAPVERRNAVGTLAQNGSEYTISAEGKNYKVLTASVTFYKASPGDQVTIILPKDHDAVWAVMENVAPKIEPSIPAVPEELETVEPTEAPLVAEKIIASPVEPLVADETPMQIPEEVTIPEPAIMPAQEVAPVLVAETVKPPISAVPETDTNGPDIEYPAGAPVLSDEQLLENLKNNLKKIDQPAYTPSESVSPRQVDNIVANDLEALGNKESTTNQGDKSIAELEI